MKLIECPRDAMQGIETFIPTHQKITYINSLLKVGFDTIDFGSFVSPKAIPQMADTEELLYGLDLQDTQSKLLSIVANQRGANTASKFEEISFLGFPLSLSETFQIRNTNRSIEEAFNTVKDIQDICTRCNKLLVVYLSMGFGNPYGDLYSPQYVLDFTERLDNLGIKIISIADTIGTSSPDLISTLFQQLDDSYPSIEFGVHLHSHPKDARAKIKAAIDAECRRIDGAILGYGGCPMAEDELVGNLDTSTILEVIGWEKAGLDQEAYNAALRVAQSIFS